MKNVWALNASATPPTKPASLEVGWPKDSGPATIPGAWWFYMVTQELLSAVTEAGLVQSDTNVTQLKDAIAIIAKKSVSSGAGIPVRLVDTVGVGLSGAQVVDGVGTVTGDRILRSVSPANVTNGIYEANNAGGWTRVADFPVGGKMTEGTLFSVAEGNTQKGTVWQMAEISGTDAILGTTSILFRNITDSLDGKFSQYLLASAAQATYAPINAPSFTGSVTLQSGIANSVPYLNATKSIVTDNNLTFDGANLSASGRVSGASVVPTGSTVPVAGMYLPAPNTVAWATASQRALSINPQGYVAIGTVSGIYQGQITGAGQGSAALADGGAVGGSLLLQDTNASAGSGGALVFGTSLGAASPFASIKGLLSDTSTGKVGHLAIGVRSLVGDATLTEALRVTPTRNLLVGTSTDTLSTSNGNVVAAGKLYGGQAIGISAGLGGQLQAIGGSSTTWYNAMLRNDGTNAQLLSTGAATSAANAVDIAANAFRPFGWNLATGAVTIDATGVGVTFGGTASGVTALSTDNSTKFATTAWVNTKLGGYAPATGAAAFLRSNGTGGFENYTIGSGLTYDAAAKVLAVNVSGALGGTVTSVDMTVPAFLTVAGGPITGSGTFAVTLSGTALPVLNGGTGTSTATGTGSVVLSNSPVLVTPSLGVPAAVTLTNATGLPLTTGVTGQLPVANGGTGTTTSTGTGSNVLSNSPVLVTPNLGTPSAAVLTNATGLPLGSGVTGTLGVTNGGTGLATMAANGALYTTALNTVAVGILPVAAGGSGVGTATGTGSNVLSDSPVLVTPNLGTPSAVNLTNATNIPANRLTGALPIAAFNNGAGATNLTFWRGDGVWATPGGGGTVGNAANLDANYVVLGAGTTSVKIASLMSTDGAAALTLGASAGTTGGTLTLSNVTNNGGTVTLAAAAGALGTSTMSLQAGTDILVGRATTDTLTNKSISGTSNSITNVSLSTGVAGVLPVANGGTGSSSGTGSGLPVFQTAATLVNPALGTPTSGNLGNCTGFPAGSLGNLGVGVGTWLQTPNSANLALAMTDETGSGSLVFANSPVLVTPNLGTPSALTLTNATGLPVSTGLSGLGTGVATWLASPSSVNLRSAMTTFTGSGNLVFATSPILVNPDLGTPSAGNLGNCYGLVLTSGAGVNGVLPIANGGTGSSTQTWVDTSTNQGIAGNKWFAGSTGFGAQNPSSVWSLYARGQFNNPGVVGDGSGGGGSSFTALSDGSAYFMICKVGGAGVGSISTNGSSTAFNTASDYRLKEKVETFEGADAVALLSRMRPVHYEWKNNEQALPEIGFIAHEMQEVLPAVVRGNKDEVDGNGEAVYQSVDYSKLTPVLVAALQETMSELKALKAEMAALKKELGV